MALRGLRLIGVAGTICVYVAGILFLSFVSLQNPNQKRVRGRGAPGYGETKELGLMGRKPPLQWCTELRYLDSPQPAEKPFKIMYTFPGHIVKKFGAIHKQLSNERDSWPNNNNNNNNVNTNNNNNNNRIENSHQDQQQHSLTALVSFPGSGNTWLRYLLQQATGKSNVFNPYRYVSLYLYNFIFS